MNMQALLIKLGLTPGEIRYLSEASYSVRVRRVRDSLVAACNIGRADDDLIENVSRMVEEYTRLDYCAGE